MQTPKGEINDKIMELTKDDALLEKMAAATSPEECYEIAKDRLDGVSFEEFQSSMSVAMAYTAEAKSGELSEDDLDQVAGGKNDQAAGDGWKVFSGIVGAGTAVIGAVVAAAVG